MLILNGMPRFLLLFTTCLAFAVVLLGAYVRLSDAGLGCPDWPGCFGRITPWHAGPEIGAAQAADPLGPVSHAKAWKEMLHRYLAGSLGLLVLTIAILARRRLPSGRRWLPMGLLALVLFQALLGMWTVTRQLEPLVVAAHLLGGMATLAGLAWLWLREAGLNALAPQSLARGLLALTMLQIALGAWMSGNGAVLACPDLPTCRGMWWPPVDFAAAFAPWQGRSGINLDGITAIHLAHRLGALVLLLGALLLAFRLAGTAPRTAIGLTVVVAVQFVLGLANVLLGVPLPVALAHVAGAACLLLCLVWLNARPAEAGP